ENVYERPCLIGLGIALGLMCITIAFVIYHCASCVFDGVNTWVSTCRVLEFVTVYLENNPEWPKSWNDLERASSPLPSDANSPASPEQFAEWKESVGIDFSLTRAEVAAMSVENFRAIKPIRPCGPLEREIKELLTAARQDDGCTVLEGLSRY